MGALIEEYPLYTVGERYNTH